MELELIKLARYYKEHPDQEEEVFQKLAFVPQVLGMGRKAYLLARAAQKAPTMNKIMPTYDKYKNIASKASQDIAKSGVKPTMGQRVGKSIPGRMAKSYGNAFRKSPGTTAMNTYFATDMGKSILASEVDKPSPYEFVQARNDLAAQMHLYKEAETKEDKIFHKESALAALMTMGE